MSNPRLLLLHNEPVLPVDHPDAASEHEVLEAVQRVGAALARAGFEVARLGVGEDLRELLDGIDALRPDAVFNLFEGLADRPFTESVVAGVLEWLGIPFTGCCSETLTLARDKQRASLVLRGAGLLTAPFALVERLPAPAWDLGWPALVKPARQDASIGIEQASVVRNQHELEQRLDHVLRRYGPALVEQFIAGREFQVSLFEGPPDAGGRRPLDALPLAEVAFQDAGLWPVYTYAAKWTEGSREYAATPLVVPARVPATWLAAMLEAARRAYAALGCRDYARVDLRVDADGRPFILEVNPNPDLLSEAVDRGLAAQRRDLSEFVGSLAEAALGRRGGPHRTQGPGRAPMPHPAAKSPETA